MAREVPLQEPQEKPEIDATNEFMLTAGQNLPNHSLSKGGRARYIAPGMQPIFRTRQSAYRFAGWLLTMAEHHLPDEEDGHTLEEITRAIRNT